MWKFAYRIVYTLIKNFICQKFKNRMMFKKHLGSERRQNKHFIFSYFLIFTHCLLFKWRFYFRKYWFPLKRKGWILRIHGFCPLDFLPALNKPHSWTLKIIPFICLSLHSFLKSKPLFLLKMQIKDTFHWQLHSVVFLIFALLWESFYLKK